MRASLKGIAAELPGAQVFGDASVEVEGICYDSRKCSPGDLFIAVRGFVSDGHAFAGEAVRRGAAALLVERRLDVPVPQVVVADTRLAMGLCAASFYGHPSRRLRLVGVTGTNGKTTTTYLVRSVLEAAGRRVGLIGTIEQSTGERTVTAARTTPEAPDIQRLFYEMTQAGCHACAMEVSSHGLVLQRTAGAEFDVAVFTNLTQDHFDFHRDLEDYLNAKTLLFRSLAASSGGIKAKKRAVVNGDDPFARRFAEAAAAPVLTYGLGEGCDVRAAGVLVEADGVRYTALTPEGEVQVRLHLTGRFNVYNSLAALAVGLVEGVPLEAAAEGLSRTVVPGRFEPVRAGQEFAIIVDYAHTPDGLENVLQTARAIARGRVICVFGAGGDRDRKKRPLMGEVAARLSDLVVVTSDNPRSEDPASICEEVAAGARRYASSLLVEVDRRKAIREAISLAREGDLVLIAGKGHETYQEIGGRRYPFDDREEAARAVKELMSRGRR